ncbi:MAG: ISKra4 family transposase, partial [Pseudanabaena sp.]
QLYPNAHYQGLADGAPENWVFLNTVTDTQTLDFYHATQYLDKAAKAIYPHDEQAKKAWMDTRCHSLKHDVGAASRILAEMQTIQPKRISHSILQGLQDAITYFRNHHLNQQSH